MRRLLKKEWDWLVKSRPGERFQIRYRRTRRERNRDECAPRALRLALGVVFLLVGFCLLFLPGPGIPVLLIGGALFASESLPLARALDRYENKMQRFVRKIRRKAGLHPLIEKLLAAGVSLGSVALAGYFCYRAFGR